MSMAQTSNGTTLLDDHRQQPDEDQPTNSLPASSDTINLSLGERVSALESTISILLKNKQGLNARPDILDNDGRGDDQPSQSVPLSHSVERSSEDSTFSALDVPSRAAASNEHGIRFLKRVVESSGKTREESTKSPTEVEREQQKLPAWWLTIREVERQRYDNSGEKSWETIIISDPALRDYIRNLLATHIDHTGKQMWQMPQVALDATSSTLILNYHCLRAAAQSSSRATSQTTRERLSILLDLLEKINDPLYFRSPVPGSRIRDFYIRFKHLWILFQPGCLITSPWNQAGDMQVFRVHGVGRSPSVLKLGAWTWDWNGHRVIRTYFEFEIPSYEEEKCPTELTCFPIQFYEDAEGRRGKEALEETTGYKNRRKLFRMYTVQQKKSPKVLHYRGDIYRGARGFSSRQQLSSRSTGKAAAADLVQKLGLNPGQQLAKIDEDIVLDVQNYTRQAGNELMLGKAEPMSDVKACYCSLCCDQETKYWTSAIEDFDSDINSWQNTINDLLLPPRLLGFALNRKEWCQFSLNCITPVPQLEPSVDGAQKNGLVFPDSVEEDERNDIYSLVRNHWKIMARPPEQRIADIIGGKGESLILLFHGYTGVGKTLYAESLAGSCGRVLFKVTMGDIGMDVSTAEIMLKEIFELAESWQAILLIDEADVLLDARGKENDSLMSKNALVSVLLREVEYFKGVLIMTTNRVKAFDPAILSRIHHAVDFEETSPDQETRIWRSWSNRLKELKLTTKNSATKIDKWIDSTMKSRKREVLSGREVRNVFNVAQALSYKDGSSMKIESDCLDRAYAYRKEFISNTTRLRVEAKSLLARKNEPHN